MDNHPIPQDVTGFKFKLIGSMTVKQFLYLLAGGILACISYILPFSIGIRIPLVVFFGGLGIALAFVPIEGRPLDVMLVNFIKAIPAENQFVYRKRGAEALIALYFTSQHIAVEEEALHDENQEELIRKRALLRNTLKLSSSYKPDAKDVSTLSNINTYFAVPGGSAPSSQTITIAPPPSDEAPPEEETPTELRVAIPPTMAGDTTPNIKPVEEISRAVPSKIPIPADKIPGDNTKEPAGIDVQKEVDDKVLQAEKRVNEALSAEFSLAEKSEGAVSNSTMAEETNPQEKVIEKAAGETETPKSVTVQNIWQTTVQSNTGSTPSSDILSEVAGTKQGKTDISAQSSLSETADNQVSQSVGNLTIENTGKSATPALGDLSTEKAKETAALAGEKSMSQKDKTSSTQPTGNTATPSSTSDEDLKKALEEIQGIKTSPAPFKIEPVKKTEDSVIPQQKDALPPLQTEEKTTPQKRAAITSPLENTSQHEEEKKTPTVPDHTQKLSQFLSPEKSAATEMPPEENKEYILKPIQKSYKTILPDESSRIHVVAPQDQLKAGFPQLPDVPNIVLGIIKGPRGKVLQNILVEIINNQGVPVRAFKTNALGQFTAATPLQNGEYDVVLEDGRKVNEFENFHITLDGSIFQPLEIYSIDDREKLRRELFGGQYGQQAAAA